MGECRYIERQIVIAMNQSERERVKTFLHELTHALIEEAKLTLPHKDIYTLEKWLYGLIKLNAWEE